MREVVVMILRPDYIKAIEPFIDSPLVKILSGVRRFDKKLPPIVCWKH